MNIQVLLNSSPVETVKPPYSHRDGFSSLDNYHHHPSFASHGRSLSNDNYHHQHSTSQLTSGTCFGSSGSSRISGFHATSDGNRYALSTYSTNSQSSTRHGRERTPPSRRPYNGSPAETSAVLRHYPGHSGLGVSSHEFRQYGLAAARTKAGRDEFPQSPPLLPPISLYSDSSNHYTAISLAADGRTASQVMDPNSYVPRRGEFSHAITQYPVYYTRPAARESVVDGLQKGSNPLMKFVDVVMEGATRDQQSLEAQHAIHKPSLTSNPAEIAGHNIDPLLRAQEPHSSRSITTSPTEASLFLPVPPAPTKPSNPTPIHRSVESNTLIHPRSSTSISPSNAATTQDVTLIAANLKDYKPLTCSFCAICTTNSPLRKVVSHIFGRNKTNTRQIPPTLWYYICRKHYQRSRYRNPKGFARQQVAMVREQCKRLREWGGVKNWIIKVRRREEQRQKKEKELREAQALASGSGSYPPLSPSHLAAVDYNVSPSTTSPSDPPSDYNLEQNQPLAHNLPRPSNLSPPNHRSTSPPSPFSNKEPTPDSFPEHPPCLPDWVNRFVGSNKTLDDVFALLDMCDAEVQVNGGIFPDVEVLPNVDPMYLVEFKDEMKRTERVGKRRAKTQGLAQGRRKRGKAGRGKRVEEETDEKEDE